MEMYGRPKTASAFRKGDVMLFQQQHPCRIVEMKSSKTGKHGSCKITFVGIHIFTAKKYQDMSPSTNNLTEVEVKKERYQVVTNEEKGTLELKDRRGPKINLKAVEPTSKRLQDDEELWVTLCTAMGKTIIQECKVHKRKENKRQH